MFAKIGVIVASAAIVAALLVARHNSRASLSPDTETVLSGDVTSQLASGAVVDTAVFAGGCFWGIEAVFEHIKGVESSVSGYAGGTVTDPTYEAVTTGRTGHAEAVRVVFDRGLVSYDQLLKVFFSVAHNPTELNRQGPDVGTQYRSAIFFRDELQKNAVTAYIAHLTKTKAFKSKIVTQVAPLTVFYMAEKYHQDYMAHNPGSMYIIINDAPKVEALRVKFPELYRER